MESKIYERQIIKQSLSHRVVDEQQIQRHFKSSEISELYKFNPGTNEKPKLPNVPKDVLLADVFIEYKDLIMSYHEHDSLLESRPEEELTEEERKAAWDEYELEKERGHLPASNPEMLNIQYQGQFNQFNNYNLNSGNSVFDSQMNAMQRMSNIFNDNNGSFSSTSMFNQSLFSLIYQNKNSILNSMLNSNNDEAQRQYNQLVQSFVANASFPNAINIAPGFTACININTIISYEGKDLSYFENDFFKSYQNCGLSQTLDTATISSYMFSYLEKCISFANGFQTKMKVKLSLVIFCKVFFKINVNLYYYFFSKCTDQMLVIVLFFIVCLKVEKR